MEVGNRLLFPLMVAAAVSVMLFGGLGLATLTGHVPLFGAKPAQFDKAEAPNVVAAVTPATDPELLVATRSIEVADRSAVQSAKCKDCGVIEAVENSANAAGGPLVPKASDNSAPPTDIELNRYLIRIRMDDGGVRVVREASDLHLQLGQRVRLIDGVVRPQS